jgi:guanylate kinase
MPTDGPPGLLLIVSAPSGTGKTSICRKILKMFPDVRFSVSWTTRPPRPGEEEGRDYHFVSKEEFRKRIERGEFVEWVENYGQLYGTARESLNGLLGRGCDLILDIEPRGAKAIREQYPKGVFIFILPPSLSELKSRLAKRGEKDADAKRRLRASLKEIREALWYDYLIFNERLDEAVDHFRAIYMAEKSRRERCAERVKEFLQ